MGKSERQRFEVAGVVRNLIQRIRKGLSAVKKWRCPAILVSELVLAQDIGEEGGSLVDG